MIILFWSIPHHFFHNAIAWPELNFIFKLNNNIIKNERMYIEINKKKETDDWIAHFQLHLQSTAGLTWGQEEKKKKKHNVILQKTAPYVIKQQFLLLLSFSIFGGRLSKGRWLMMRRGDGAFLIRSSIGGWLRRWSRGWPWGWPGVRPWCPSGGGDWTRGRSKIGIATVLIPVSRLILWGLPSPRMSATISIAKWVPLK